MSLDLHDRPASQTFRVLEETARQHACSLEIGHAKADLPSEFGFDRMLVV
jgi:hypothetical protein